jgi:hypothetical protein
MKRRKTILLSEQVIARAERFAAESGKTLSSLVEEQLLTLPSINSQRDPEEDFWPGPALKPLKRSGNPRFEYLRRKHA